MPAHMRIRVTEERPPDVTIRQWRVIGRESHVEAVRYWMDHFRPRHFQPGAATRYGYQERTEKWIDRKKAAIAKRRADPDAERPLIFRGNLRRRVMADHAIRGFPTRAKIEFTPPVYVPERPYAERLGRSNQPPMANEIIRTTADERTKLEQVLLEGYVRRIEAIREKRVTEIK